MVAEVGALFTAIQLTRMIAELTGVIESLGVKVDKLLASELKAGLRALEQAENAGRERQSLLREARARFNTAIAVEKQIQLAAAYIALAATHYHLKDFANCDQTLRELLDTDFESSFAKEAAEFAKEGPKRTALTITRLLPLPGLGPLGYAAEQMAKSALADQERIGQLKNAVRTYLGGRPKQRTSSVVKRGTRKTGM